MITNKLRQLVKDNHKIGNFFITDEIVNELSEHCDPTKAEIKEVFGNGNMSVGAMYQFLKASRNWTFPEDKPIEVKRLFKQIKAPSDWNS